MEKLYRVVITEIDPETKAEKEVHIDELYENVTLIADCAERNTMAEVVLNDNLVGIAAKLASGEKVKAAMKLAAVMAKILDDRAGNAEDSLLDSLLRAIRGE